MTNSERQARYRNRLKEAALANSGGAAFIDPEVPFVGNLAEAPLKSLVVPLSEYAAATFLVCGNETRKMAFSLGPNLISHAFECAEIDHHKGLIFPDVRLRVDFLSAYDPNEGGATLGSLWRKRDAIGFYGIANRRGFDERQQIAWSDPPQPSNEIVGYHRWQIVIEGDDELILLHQVDLTSET